MILTSFLFDVLQSTVKRDRMKSPPCVVDMWGWAGGGLNQTPKVVVSWPWQYAFASSRCNYNCNKTFYWLGTDFIQKILKEFVMQFSLFISENNCRYCTRKRFTLPESNQIFHYTRCITAKGVASWEAHHRVIALGQHCSFQNVAAVAIRWQHYIWCRNGSIISIPSITIAISSHVIDFRLRLLHLLIVAIRIELQLHRFAKIRNNFDTALMIGVGIDQKMQKYVRFKWW